MAPYLGFDEHEGNSRRSSRSNDDFDWGYLLAASPGLCLFAIAIIIKVFL